MTAQRVNGVRLDPRKCPGNVREDGTVYHSSDCCMPNENELLEKWLIEMTEQRSYTVPYVK